MSCSFSYAVSKSEPILSCPCDAGIALTRIAICSQLSYVEIDSKFSLVCSCILSSSYSPLFLRWVRYLSFCSHSQFDALCLGTKYRGYRLGGGRSTSALHDAQLVSRTCRTLPFDSGPSHNSPPFLLAFLVPSRFPCWKLPADCWCFQTRLIFLLLSNAARHDSPRALFHCSLSLSFCL
jgi:hypothetical protein